MKKALIVVDYQKDFVDGALGFEKAVQLEQAICRKIEQAREQGLAQARIHWSCLVLQVLSVILASE